MNQIEFGKLCQPLNKQYFALFHCVPVPTDYLATREEYLAALKTAIEKKAELSTLLPLVEKGDDPNSKY